MTIAFQRSLLTRLVEGLIRDFRANTDAAAYWSPADIKINKGPFIGDDKSVRVPQLLVSPAPGAFHSEEGVSGVQSAYVMSTIVCAYEYMRSKPWVIGANDLNEYDRLDLLKRIIRTGSSDGESPGKIIDPDNSMSPDPTQRYLNTEDAVFDDDAPRITVNKAGEMVAVRWAFVASFVTRIDNLTLLRK